MRRKHDLVDDSDARKTKTMYAAFVPRSYGWVFKFFLYFNTSSFYHGPMYMYHTNAYRRTRSNHIHPGFFSLVVTPYVLCTSIL